MEQITLFADVLLPLPIKGTFTYRVPRDLNEFIKPGHRVSIQFGKRRIYAGIVRNIHTNVPQDTIPKYIITLLDEYPIVNEIQFKFWEWLSSYYMSTLGEIMNAALPNAFKLASESKIALSPLFVTDKSLLNKSEYQITEALMTNSKLTIGDITNIVGYKKVLPLIKTMIENKMLVMEEELKDTYKPKIKKYITLNKKFHGEEKLHVLMDDLGKRAHKQLEILMSFISQAGIPIEGDFEISQKELLQRSGGSDSAMKALITKEVLICNERIVSRLDTGNLSKTIIEVILSEHQEKAYSNIQSHFSKHNVVLLHGVTSGGKTELYIKLIFEMIAKGKQVLYLLPEIALTTQIISRLRQYFGDRVGVYHSRYSQNERVEVWNNINGNGDGNNFDIILGPRSSLFLPYDNLGLIIVDEEHDSSYKQYDPSPRYNARDAAIYLATLHGAKVLLGSATPSIESYYNALNGKYGLSEITQRYGNIKLPRVSIVNLKEEHKRRMMKSHFSSVLMHEVTDAIKNDKQSILFQNRRGFSLRIECDICHWVPECKNCDVTLTYHKFSELIKCHYCGYSTTIPQNCPDCGNGSLKMQGFGTEKVTEELGLLLKDARIDRMDLDTTRGKNSYSKIISDFEKHNTDILVGTQMVTKGLDFDNVSVVGILSADSMLNFPDFRAHERSFQLMSQVSGRAGRKDKQGTVIIQSWKPDNAILKDVVNHDFQGMYHRILEDRKKFLYPPFYRLIVVRMKHRKTEVLNHASTAFVKCLRDKYGNLVYGPEYPLVGRIRNFYIKQAMIKIPKGMNLSEVKNYIHKSVSITKTVSEYKSVIFQFDVDPL